MLAETDFLRLCVHPIPNSSPDIRFVFPGFLEDIRGGLFLAFPHPPFRDEVNKVGFSTILNNFCVNHKMVLP